MKILHLASFNRWTGAAAPAFSEVEALRRAGVDAHYGYVGGSTLEAKLGAFPFAHVAVSRAQAPWSVARAVRRLRRLIREEGFTIVHAHLAHDHWLARAAVRPLRGVALLRTFHALRTLRTDPLTRWLVQSTDGVCVNNATFLDHPLVAVRSPVFTPPPVDERILAPGPDVREIYGVPRDAPLLGFIGKIVPGRGFEQAIETLAHVRKRGIAARLLIIGRGPHKAALEAYASTLGVAAAILWAGYHEDDLAEHLRTPDIMLFTARGSDEGHRAIVESLACGTPVASYPIYGVAEVLGPLAGRLLASEPSPEAVAEVCRRYFEGGRSVAPAECVAASAPSQYGPTAQRLAELYERVASASGRRSSVG